MAEAKEEAKVAAEEVSAAVASVVGSGGSGGGGEEKADASGAGDASGGAAAAAGAEDAAAPAEESPFYKELLKPQLLITRFRPGRQNNRGGRTNRLNALVDRSRRMLRAYETIQISGVENGMATACTLVEILKREKVAVIHTVNTHVNVVPRFPDNYAEFSASTLSIDFVLARGENALYITDIKQRRLISIFEKYDPDRTGSLPKGKVEELDMGDTFYSTDVQKANAAAFLKAIPGDGVSMPDFIKYASALIDDTLRTGVFRSRLAERYGLPGPPAGRQQGGGGGGAGGGSGGGGGGSGSTATPQ